MAGSHDSGSDDRRAGLGSDRRASAQPASSRDAFMADLGRLLAAESQTPLPAVQSRVWHALSSALASHLAPPRNTGAPPRGGLAPWQETLAKEMLAAHVGSRLPVSRIAAACQLSRSHFSLAFKRSTGQTPHRWLTALRIDKARLLLQDPQLSIAEIAGVCGFADQSHLTRVFNDVVGVPPGLWRRAQGRSGHAPTDGANDATNRQDGDMRRR